MASTLSALNGISARNNYLDFWRGIALLAVIVVHYLAGLDGSIYTTQPLRPLYIFLNQLMRFSVPLFVALSGYSLAKKYANEPFTFYPFITKRLMMLLPPFVIWSLGIALMLRLIPSWSVDVPDFTLTNLLLGQLDYHLYFIPMLVGLYLLFPLLHRLMAHRATMVLILMNCLQLLWFIALWYPHPQASWVHLAKDQLQYVIPLSWIGYFALGSYLGRHPGTISRQRQAVIFAIAAIGLAYSTFQAHSLQTYQELDIIITTRFTRIPVIWYTAPVIYLILSHVKQSAEESPIVKLIVSLGKNSYSLYLIHTIILRLYFSWLVHYQLAFSQVFGICIIISLTSYLAFKSVPLMHSLNLYHTQKSV